MKQFFLILISVLIVSNSFAGEGLCYATFDTKPKFSAGIRMQKSMGFYYTGGITGEYSSPRFLNNKLSLGANFTGSVLGNGIRKNAVKTYEIDISAIKYFRDNKKIQPVTRLNVGYMYASYGKDFKDKIPNQSILCSLEFAAALNVNPNFKPVLGFGYNIITGNGNKGLGMIFPLYAQFTLLYNL